MCKWKAEKLGFKLSSRCGERVLRFGYKEDSSPYAKIHRSQRRLCRKNGNKFPKNITFNANKRIFHWKNRWRPYLRTTIVFIFKVCLVSNYTNKSEKSMLLWKLNNMIFQSSPNYNRNIWVSSTKKFQFSFYFYFTFFQYKLLRDF